MKINDNDNVLIALNDLDKGMIVNEIVLLDDIPKAHKLASTNILKGEDIIKYGMPIGHALVDIKKGEHIHTHNVLTNLNDLIEYEFLKENTKVDEKKLNRMVNVYKRSNGEVGIRNELFVIPTVGCTTSTANEIVEAFKSEYDVNQIDGIHVFSHPDGCSQMGDDHENTKLTLQNIAKHPNAGGVLVVGLGCENNQVDAFMEGLKEVDSTRVKSLVVQDVENEITEGVKLLRDIYEVMKEDKREEVSLSKIKFGLECGGSDGFSGITANVMLGKFSDVMIQNGGTTVLTEVPEMFGAETRLMSRAQNKHIFDDIVNMINSFKKYYKDHNQVIYENPSPGNKKGGITTLEEKSLGCCEKAGKSEIVDVLTHGELIKKNGLNLLSAPGNDLVATTALGMSGCHLVLFTTGRGTPFGGFIPTVKISTNTALYQKKKHWIDFDAGVITAGIDINELTNQFINYVVDVCNGCETNNEKNNFREITIFKSGVTL
jgi:altronate hydrolase